MMLLKRMLRRLLWFCINSLHNYTEDDLWEISNRYNTFITKDEICSALKISRYELSKKIKNNTFPKGRKRKGKKELFWIKEELIKFDSRIEKCQEYPEDRVKREIKRIIMQD